MSSFIKRQLPPWFGRERIAVWMLKILQLFSVVMRTISIFVELLINRIFAIRLMKIQGKFTRDFSIPLQLLYGVHYSNLGSLDLIFFRIMNALSLLPLNIMFQCWRSFLTWTGRIKWSEQFGNHQGSNRTGLLPILLEFQWRNCDKCSQST